eukprot:TRINITY_DN10902_c0_g1_i1.p2 TRINITY_DN10902_c0_g1~~TRINITY_DN10902_c0_g1_i1.p2  ORF type:complete len:208 (-),score=9.50 TRINITY_DN10902_c0_g1_i1:209-832(-)
MARRAVMFAALVAVALAALVGSADASTSGPCTPTFNPCCAGKCSNQTDWPYYSCGCNGGAQQFIVNGKPFCDPDPCKAKPCGNGTCTTIKGAGGFQYYTCSCPSGETLQTVGNFQYCTANPCTLNTCSPGQCMMVNSTANTCTCPNGYMAKNILSIQVCERQALNVTDTPFPLYDGFCTANAMPSTLVRAASTLAVLLATAVVMMLM